MSFEKSYAVYWAKDVVTELGLDSRNKNFVNWVLRWMKRNRLEPEQESVTSMADSCSREFLGYLQIYYPTMFSEGFR
jgi:hypothetical protein